MRNVRVRPSAPVTSFRRIAAAAWDPPRDPTIYGSVEVDATPLLAYLDGLRGRGIHATVTHAVGRALAIVLAEHPELNVLVRLGRFYRREDVDILFQVAQHGDAGDPAEPDLSAIVLRGVDTRSVAQIAAEFAARTAATRADRDAEMASVRRSMGRIPPLLLRPLHRLLDFVQYTLNLRVPGLPRDAFGSAMVTNVGMFGISDAYAPLFPPSHCPVVMLVGAITRRPWVVHDERGERVEVRPVLPLRATLDHRVVDGVQAARVAARLRALLAAPELLDRAPLAGPGPAPADA